MLGFTHDPRKSNNAYQLDFQEQYKSFTITNNGPSRPQLIAAPTRPKKSIVKSHSNQKLKKSVSSAVRQSKDISGLEKGWNEESVTKTVGMFDRDLKLNSLAAEERRMRAEIKMQENKKRQESDPQNRTGKIMKKEQKLHEDKIKIVTQEQQRDIQRLKQMIEKERLEKEKSDLEYEAKKKQIEEQRKKLLEIEREIQRQGPKVAKQMRYQLESVATQDRVKLKETLNQQNPRRQAQHNNFNNVTQTQSLANQKNVLRQQQLEYLIDQRERNFKQYQKNTMGYTPTLIPLLSKASYKIVSTHISSLVQLLIDDMLEEQVYLLEAIELEAKAGKAQQRQKEMLHDYVNRLENFVQEAETIEQKLGKYNQLRFQQIYKPPVPNVAHHQSQFSYSSSNFTKLQLRLTDDDIQELNHRNGRFHRYVSSFDEYKLAYLDMFKKVTEECIDEAIHKMVIELDSGAGEFVNLVFRSQFQ